MSDKDKDYDYSIHSDFIVHWTGKDIDEKWPEEGDDKSKTSEQCEKRYIKRFKDILKYGLWMTEEEEPPYSGVTIPATPKCCFTELKVSESRRHARKYGRLGIGVKRQFLFDRKGRPLAYFGFLAENNNDEFLKACSGDFKDKRLLNFFKPMNSGKPLNYDFYGESEWRIIFFEELLKNKIIIDPRDSNNKKAHAYYIGLSEEEQKKLKYLIPLDGWFSLIIYPSLSVKNIAQRDGEIINEIKRLKENKNDRANKVEGGNWPIEMDLDACRNF